MYQGSGGGGGTFKNPIRQKRKEMLEQGQMSKRMGDVLFSGGGDGESFKNPLAAQQTEKREHQRKLGEMSDAVTHSMFKGGHTSMHMYSNPSERRINIAGSKKSSQQKDEVGDALFGQKDKASALSSMGTSTRNPAFNINP